MSHREPPSDAKLHAGPSEHAGWLPRVVRNSTFNAVGMALIVPLNFIALFTMAQRLGAAAMGVYFTLFAISAVIHWIADAGTSTVLTRRVAREPENLRTLVAESMGVMLVVCTISISLFMLVSIPWMWFTLGEVPWWLLIVAALAMVARHAIDFASNIFRGLERFEFENLARVVQSAAFCGFIWMWVHGSDHGTLDAYIAYTASNLLAMVLVWGMLLAGWCCPAVRLSVEMVRRWFTESIPLGIGDVVQQCVTQLDTLMLALLSSSVNVGLFSVASRPLQPLRLVPRTIVSVTFPMLSRSAHVDRTVFARTFAKTINLLWLASLPICIATATCAEPLVLKTAGEEFAAAIDPLRLLIWATVLTFVNVQLRFAFTALDAEQKFWRMSVGSLMVKIPLCALGILMFGIYGACAAVLLGELVAMVWGLVVLRSMNLRGPSVLQLLRALPAGIAMYFALRPFVEPGASLLWLGLGVVTSSLVYLVACVVTGAWPREDIKVFQRAFRSSFGGVAPTAAPSRGS
ncbi:flippase [Aeoliella sp. SH292]|uniref:flippase n=1 Tax=Aeoliella sp. SH292 TaxID=3454464 RepID=UPI003F987AE6